MAKLIFKYTDNDYIESAREASEIEFVIPENGKDYYVSNKGFIFKIN